MSDFGSPNSHKFLEHKQSYYNRGISPCNDVQNVSIIVHKKKNKKLKRHKVFYAQKPNLNAYHLLSSSSSEMLKPVTKHSSLPEMNNYKKPVQPCARSMHTIERRYKYPFRSKFIVNVVSEHRFDACLNPYNYPSQTKWKIYRCQLNTHEESCCCSCNSDAMFEVMKSLYDCYKKKNCDNCDCILCGHVCREERQLGEMRKSLGVVGMDTTSAKERKEKIKKAEKALEGKSPAEKENLLREMAKTRQPLPEGKTPSEKALVDKIRNELGLPPEPKTAEEKIKMRKAEAAGIITPLEGKTAAQKEKILKAQAALGIPLPEGRTPSEKAIIQKVKAAAGIPDGVTSEKLRKARAAGLITPLEGKSPEQKEKILKGLAIHGIQLPEGTTPSEKKLIDKVRAEIGLPPEPKSKAMRDRYAHAANAGLLQPLEGKSPREKERILQGLADLGIPLPEGRTPSEKSLVAKVKARAGPPLDIIAPSEKMRRAKAAGLITPLAGKTPEQREKILRGLAMQGIPLPEGQTPSERKLIDKVRADLGLPPEPKTKAIRDKHEAAANIGLLQPLEGKTPAQKEKILQGLHDMGIPLPEGRTPSEKSLIAKIKAGPRALSEVLAPSEKIRPAKAEGFLTPLKGKTPEQKEKILKGLAKHGLLFPEGQTPSEKKLIDKVRTDLGLPPEPTTPELRDKYTKAADAGFLQPLEGKSPKEKEKILQGLHDMGIPLPEGRSPSEKALIAKVRATPGAPLEILAPAEKMRRAKAAGLITPLEGKTPEQKQKILNGLAMHGLPIPEGKTPSEKKLIDKIRADLGLPPEPKTPEMRDKYAKAADAGYLQPLEGKTPAQKEKILQGLHNMGIPLPEGRTPSEKSLIAKVKARSRILAPSERMRKAKAEGLLTPLKGKTPAQKEKILKGLAKHGLPLPEAKSPSEKQLVDKIRADLGLPPEPKTPEMRDKYAKAADAGLMQPLEGKSPKEKERILQGLHDMGIPLPEGRSPSEKALIAQVKARPRAPSAVLKPSERLRRAKAEGLLTPLKGKTPAQREKVLKGLAKHGLPLPEAKTPSEKQLVDKIRADLGLPPEPKTPEMRDKHAKAADAGLMQPLEGKSPKEKERILQGLHDMGIPLPEGRSPSEKALIAQVKARPRAPSAVLKPSERLRRAKAEGLLTPLKGKTPAQREKILKGLAKHGLPLPEAKTPSEKQLVDKIRNDLGLPPEPKTPEMRDKYAKAGDAGLMQPLEGKSPKEKERILQGLHDMGIPLPEGRSPSEKALIAQVKARPRAPSAMLKPSERLRRAKAEGLLTPLKGKTPAQREKILKGLAKHGLPLPEAKTPSEKQLVDKIRNDLGLPPEPKTPEMRDKYAKAGDAGLMQPLEGKSPKEKERILQGLHDMGIPLPEGRSPSEKALIAQVKARPRAPSAVLKPSERLRRAKAEGLLTPLKGKTPAQREKILKGLAKHGLPLPEAKTPSEKQLVDKLRNDLGLPPEPKTPEMRDKYAKAADAGLMQPLEGKSPKEKERILQGLHDMGIPLPEGRSPSEKALIAQVKARPRAPSAVLKPSERLRRAKAEGLLTPLKGKTPAQREKILKGLAKHGLSLPEAKTPSEKQLVDKIRNDLGLPPEPKTPEMRDKYAKAADAGLMQPLEGKSPKEKERILQGLHDMGIPLPEGRSPSEKALIAQVQARPRAPSAVLKPSERLRRAKAAGLITPLEGKTPEQKQKILNGLAMHGLPLPEGKTPSEKKLIDNIRADLGLPPEPKTPEMRDKYAMAADAGLLQPLEGKSPAQKENILQGLHNMGIPLPEGRTPSEKSLIAKVKARPRIIAPSEKMRRAKAAGLLTPLEGKTPEQKEKILKGLASHGVPLPEGKTPSEKKIIDKVRAELGLPPEPKTPSLREKYAKAQADGLITPLEGKSPTQKENILRAQAARGLLLPEGRTPSEKSLIAKIKREPPPSITTDKIRKAKAAGLFTPLAGKTPEQREKVLKGLAKAGLPLPEGKTPSEQALINQIKKEFGIPDRTPSEKLRKAKAAGLLTPLEDKTPTQKEKILRGRAAAGFPLPEGRSPSERALIQKIKDDTGFVTPSPSERLRKARAAGLLTPLKGKSPSMKEKIIRNMLAAGVPIPEGETPSEKQLISKLTAEPTLPKKSRSERMKQAKAAGFLTPLQGKTPDQKRHILKGLVNAGLPLPEPKTESEKDLIDKIREEAGLPPEPKSPSLKEKYKKAQAAGLITPLEGKTPVEKENILKRLYDAGIPLPEGRSPSEKSMIKRVKAGLVERKTPSEKLKAAKAAGFLTPLEGKTPAQKEKILRGLAKTGVPLPEGKTPSEKDLIDKIRTEMGLPPEPKTPSLREKMQKAHAEGIITPLEGKTPAQKQKILKALADAGIPLPEGRTPSEKSLISKIKADTKPRKIPSEKIRKAKAAGLLRPLEGKTPEEKERILRGLAEHGLPLPEAKTPSEKKLAAKIRKELGLPPTPKTLSMKERHERAAADGVLVPLEGLTPAEKERVLRAQADLGLPLPEGRTPSEKSLIAKVKAESKMPTKIPSEKLRKAKAAGLLTPLEGKSPEEKEKIMRGLAEQGLPLPEAKTTSEKKLAAKIRKELGLPPTPKTPSMKERHNKAAAAGFLVPLEGLSPTEKERILRAQADLGLPLPEGRTPSEKSLIAKIRAEQGPSKISSEKLRQAQAAGLLTPLEGKTPAEQERIIRGLAEAGLPLPEGKSASEKSMIHKIKTELGIPPPATTASEKSVIRKAKAEGLFTPITGKSPDEKERILRGLAEAGLPLPVGKTPSEKELIKKVRAEAGLQPEPTPSEKMGKIKKKSKKVGISASKKLGKGIEAEEFEDIIKTTTCDRGCGCDKKKIRFKHSYVKIRVTSPDISSLCPCPEECIPGVKAGAFIDNEGIKVTVGRVVATPLYPRDYSNYITFDKIISKRNRDNRLTKLLKKYLFNTSNVSICKEFSPESCASSAKVDNNFNSSGSDISRPISWPNRNHYLQNSTLPYEGRISESDRISRDILSPDDISNGLALRHKSSRFSFDSILVIKSETSLSLTTSVSRDSDIMAVTSTEDSSITSSCTHYSRYQFTDGKWSFSSIERSKFRKRSDSNSNETITSSSEEPICRPSLLRKLNANRENNAETINKNQNEYMIFRMSEEHLNSMNNIRKRKDSHGEPFVVIDKLTRKLDITTMVDKLLSKKEYSGASSIFIVVPTSDDNDAESSSNTLSSNTSIESSKKPTSGINIIPGEPNLRLKIPLTKHGVPVCGKGKKFYMQEIKFSFHDVETKFNNEPLNVFRHKENTKNKVCQITTPNKLVQIAKGNNNVVTTDTTMDRPCCCRRKETAVIQKTGSRGHYGANVMSSENTVSYFNQGTRNTRLQESYLSVRSSQSCDNQKSSAYSSSYNSKQIHKQNVPKNVYPGRSYGLIQSSDISKRPQEFYLSAKPSPTLVSACDIPGSSAYSSYYNSKHFHKHSMPKCGVNKRHNHGINQSPDNNKRRQESSLSIKPSSSRSKSAAHISYHNAKKIYKHPLPKYGYEPHSYGSFHSVGINKRASESYWSMRPSSSPVSVRNIPDTSTHSNYHNSKHIQKKPMAKYGLKRQGQNHGLLHSPDNNSPQESYLSMRTSSSLMSRCDILVSAVQDSSSISTNINIKKRPQESYLSIKPSQSPALASNTNESSSDSSCENSKLRVHERLMPRHKSNRHVLAPEPCHCNRDQLKALLELAARAGVSMDNQSFGCISSGKDSVTINTATASKGDCHACLASPFTEEPKFKELYPCDSCLVSNREYGPKDGMRSMGIITKVKGSNIVSGQIDSGSSGSRRNRKSPQYKKTRFRDDGIVPVIAIKDSVDNTSNPDYGSDLVATGSLNNRPSLNILPDKTEPHDLGKVISSKKKSEKSEPTKYNMEKLSGLLSKLSFSQVSCKCDEKVPEKKPSKNKIGKPDDNVHQKRSENKKHWNKKRRKSKNLAVQTEPMTNLTELNNQNIDPTSNQAMPNQTDPMANLTELNNPNIEPKSNNADPKSNNLVAVSNKADPTSKKTIPENKKTIPDNNKSIADKSKMVPDNNKVFLENKKTNPENNKTIPDHNKTIPVASKTVPDKLVSESDKLHDQVSPKAEEVPQVSSLQKPPGINTKDSFKNNKFLSAIGKLSDKPKTKMDCECTQGGKTICKCHEVHSDAGGTARNTCGCIDVIPEKVICKCYPKAKKITKSTSDSKVGPDSGQGFGLPPQYEYMEFPHGPSCGWIDTGEIMRMRSEMTLTTSGFKLQQKKRDQILTEKIAREGPEIELDFEDAIKYYASLNPQKFRELMQDTLNDEDDKGKKKGKKKKKDKKKKSDKGKNKDAKKRKGKGKNKEQATDTETDTTGSSDVEEIHSDITCDCPYGPIPPPISYDTTTSESAQDDGRITGLKFSIGGKGSASPGFAGIYFFDTTKESYTSW